MDKPNKTVSKYSENLVHLAAMVSPEIKAAVMKFGLETRRTGSAAVYHLLATHPDLTEVLAELKKEQALTA